MIKHAGLSIRNIQEIYDFYEQILKFEKTKQFPLFREFAQEIFGFEESPEVFVLKKEDIELELFVSQQKFKPAYTHTCLETQDAEEIYKRAKNRNYKTYLKAGKNDSTWFVADFDKNLFELKKPLKK